MYGHGLPGYDAWLEAPYVAAAEAAEREEAVIEALGLTEEEAENFDFGAYFADEDEARYEDEAEARREAEADDSWLDQFGDYGPDASDF